jgi:hypothetical protein
MEKICVDCGKKFSPPCNRPIRCLECQKEFRKGYQKEYQSSYWDTISTNSHQSKFYQYSKFAKTLTDDELVCLVIKHIKCLKYARTYDERQDLQTYIKILGTEYSSRDEERVTRQIEAWESGDY